MDKQNSINGKLSVVIPCYNSEKSIVAVIEKNDRIFQQVGVRDYEYILVNDNSKDNTFQVIRSLAETRDDIVAVNLAKNFGQHSALMAAFHYVSGDLVVTCEDDGQTNMEVIGEMFEKLNCGYDVVSTFWEDRGRRSLIRRASTGAYNFIADRLLPNPNKVNVSIFFLARRFVIDEMIKYTQPYPFIIGLVLRTTSNIGVITCKQLPRKEGRSGYTFAKLLRLWLDSFTAFSIIPLRVATFLGSFTAVLGLIYAIITVIRKIIDPSIATGWSSLMAAFLVVSGMVLCVLGMIGEYVGRIYMCINSTPQFIIREVVRGNNNVQKDTDN